MDSSHGKNCHDKHMIIIGGLGSGLRHLSWPAFLLQGCGFRRPKPSHKYPHLKNCINSDTWGHLIAADYFLPQTGMCSLPEA